MTVPVPVTLTTIQAAGWGAIVASDVNGLLARATALEAINAGTRLGTAESEIDALQASVAVASVRNAHTYNPGQVVLQGGSCQFDVEQARTGITVNEDYSAWDIVTAGVYAVSWGVQCGGSTGFTYLTVEAYRFARFDIESDGWSYGSFVGYMGAGDTIVVRCDAGGTVTYLDGFIRINRVADGV